MSLTVVLGSIVHCVEFGSVVIIDDGCLIVEKEFNTIKCTLDLSKEEDLASFESYTGMSRQSLSESSITSTNPTVELFDYRGKMIMPGFIDAHIHAPQHVFSGTGMDLELLQWLKQYTFPTEYKFCDIDFARANYEEVVQRTLKSGTTFASYFATIHCEASVELAKICQRIGQRAYVGKVSMDHNDDPYVEELESGLKEEETFIQKVLSLSPQGQDYLTSAAKLGQPADVVKDSALEQDLNKLCLLNKKETPLVLPVITPRFAVACTSEMMRGLEKLYKFYSLPLQSHLSESLGEIEYVKHLFPEDGEYTEIYGNHGLLGERTYMAHCCHCVPSERQLLHSSKTAIVHCPNSNFMMLAGFCDVRQYLKDDIKVSLGTDVAGGYANSMLDAIRHTIMGSRQLSILKAREQQAKKEAEFKATGEQVLPLGSYKLDDFNPINNWEALYLATVGGAKALNMDNVLGNFLPGKKFDGLVVDIAAKDTPIDSNHLPSSTLTKLEKFLFLGDDRNIVKVFVDGKLVISK